MLGDAESIEMALDVTMFLFTVAEGLAELMHHRWNIGHESRGLLEKITCW